MSVLFRRGVEIDDTVGIARADGDLVHVDVGSGQQRAGLGHGHDGDGARHVLGAERRAFQRIDRDIDLRAVLVAHLLADEEHGRFVALALADHHRAVDRELVQLAAHGIHGSLVGGLLVAAPAKPGGSDGGALGDADELQGQDALDELPRLDGNALRHGRVVSLFEGGRPDSKSPPGRC